MVLVMFFSGRVLAEEAAVATGDKATPSAFAVEEEKLASAPKESFEFQAEVNRLMDIIINSLCKLTFMQASMHVPHIFPVFPSN